VSAHWRGAGVNEGVNDVNEGVNNSNLQNALAPLLLPMILSQIPMTQNVQSNQNITTGFAADVDTNNIDENIYQEFGGNKATTSSQPDIPIYPENGVIKGGIANDFESNKDILQQSGGYIYPDKKSRNYNKIDERAVWFNDRQNKNRPDAKQMLEIGIYGVDSYDDNNQFKHIQDGSADYFNKKYNLTGNKTIPSDMKGIEFSKNSDFSKRISENRDFQQTVKDAIDKNGGKLRKFNKSVNIYYKKWLFKDFFEFFK